MTDGQSTTCSACSRRAGLTLIEVVAALALLGLMLTGVVLAKSRHTRQSAMSARVEMAVRAADEQIAAWWASADGVPRDDTGLIASDQTLRWQTRVVANPPIDHLGGQVVRVEIIDDLRGPGSVDPLDEPLVVVDLVLPDPDWEALPKPDPPEAGAGDGLPGVTP